MWHRTPDNVANIAPHCAHSHIIIGIQFKQSQLSALWSTLWASGLAALDKYLITLATKLQF